MKKYIQPSTLQGEIWAPASKSMAQRGIAAALLSKGMSKLTNYTACNDSESAIEVARLLGAKISKNNRELHIQGGGTIQGKELHCGEAGLGIRMFTPIAAALSRETVTMTGAGSLKTRPVDMVEKPLQDLGAKVQTANGYIPIQVCGPIIGGTTIVDGSLSSQFLTGLLLALPLAQKDTLLSVIDLQSKPYIDMTLEVLHHFGISVIHDDYKTFTIKGNQEYKASEFNIEGDWSGAAFLLVAGAISGEIEVKNLDVNSKQADIAILEALKKAGASCVINKDTIQISKSKLTAFELDATHCPDLFPPLVCLAAYCKGVTKITGTQRLTHKESNRAMVLKNEFEKLGIRIDLADNTMIVHGGNVQGGEIFAHNDHRIAMAGAVAALASQRGVSIINAECIAKSYPSFYDDIASIGCIVK